MYYLVTVALVIREMNLISPKLGREPMIFMQANALYGHGWATACESSHLLGLLRLHALNAMLRVIV